MIKKVGIEKTGGRLPQVTNNHKSKELKQNLWYLKTFMPKKNILKIDMLNMRNCKHGKKTSVHGSIQTLGS